MRFGTSSLVGSRGHACAVLAVVVIVGAPTHAEANGLTTHSWITLEARNHLPEAHPLRDLVDDPTLYDALVSGTIFPDGGYAVGDGYGETAHWEPFHAAYAAWLLDHHPPPWVGEEDRRYATFLFGMLSHGMADECFDAIYMERSRGLDPGWNDDVTDLDTASDVLFAGATGGILLPTVWLPAEDLASVFATGLGYSVSAETLASGTELAHVALQYVDWAKDQPERIDFFAEQFPWTAEHIAEEGLDGAPRDEAKIVAAYWERWWDRLHGDVDEETPLVFAVRPEPRLDGGVLRSFLPERDHEAPEARLWIGLRSGPFDGELHEAAVESDGAVDAGFWQFYGDQAHGLLVVPQADWAEDTDFRLTLPAGLNTADGAEHALTEVVPFSTRAPPVALDEAPPPGEAGCGAGAAATALMLLTPPVAGRRRRRVSAGS